MEELFWRINWIGVGEWGFAVVVIAAFVGCVVAVLDSRKPEE